MNFLKTIRQIILKYKHGVILLYFFIYITWFEYLERTVKTFTPIHCKLDDIIPFNEYFIIPYLLWFFYIFVTGAYFLLFSKTDFYKYCAYLFIGMTICLTIYTLFHNGQNLRPDLDSLGRKNIFINLVSNLYKVDTPANVFPSIHVFNSIGALIAINKSSSLRPKKWLRWSAFFLTVFIILSILFLKQHSVLDALGAFALNIIMYVIVYVPSWGKTGKRTTRKPSNI